jgi:hypothetical protein
MQLETRPLKPVREHGAASARDEAKDGYSLHALEELVSDCESQPDWRDRSDKAHAYYDMGKQLTPEAEHKIRTEWGIEPRQINLIHGVVNGVLGQEAKARSDVRIEADDDDFQDVADVLSKKHKEATREANIDMAVSNGYAGQVKGGIGWVEVSRAADPLDYPYRVTDVHRSEIWWDMRATDLGLKDARWLVRKRWMDLDEAIAWMPEHRRILEQALNGWDLIALPEDHDNILYRSYSNERRTRIRRDEWADTRRQRIKMYEVWYRVPAETVVLHVGPGKRLAYDETNPLHIEAVSRGTVKISRAITRQVRMALFAGPHRLLDQGTRRRHFPYVPFFAFRDDEDRTPYGLIEGMITPQDEYNERRQMINWMLKARQLVADSDALDEEYNNIADITKTMNRPDMVAVLNPDRRNANAFQIANGLRMEPFQVDVMQDSKALIQEVPRVYSTQLGQAQQGVTSGVAINSLTEQGIVAMGELNDNYRFARKLVHEQVLEMIVEDHLDEDLKVVMGAGQNKRVIMLNSWDPQTGAPINRVKDAPVKVGLSDVPTSPAFRMQEQQQVATMLQAFRGDPQALAILGPVFIEGSSLSNRQAIADDLRRAKGVPVAGDRQQQQQQQAQQQEMMARTKALEDAKTEAEVAKLAADVRVADTVATLNAAKAREIGHTVARDLHNIDREEAMPNRDADLEAALAEAAQT